MMEKKIKAVEELWDALRVFEDKNCSVHFRDKADPEQDVEELIQFMYGRLDKLKRFYKGEYNPPVRSHAEALGRKMATVANALQNGSCKVDSGVADEFMQAIELLDVAREAKEKGKTLALKDKYQNI
jgi:hypothetical protein